LSDTQKLPWSSIALALKKILNKRSLIKECVINCEVHFWLKIDRMVRKNDEYLCGLGLDLNGFVMQFFSFEIFCQIAFFCEINPLVSPLDQTQFGN
jgi:hypothetical protein